MQRQDQYPHPRVPKSKGYYYRQDVTYLLRLLRWLLRIILQERDFKVSLSFNKGKVIMTQVLNAAPGETGWVATLKSHELDGSVSTDVTIRYVSDNSDVASVDFLTGSITIGVKGTANVTATATRGSFTHSVTGLVNVADVIVTPPPTPDFTVDFQFVNTNVPTTGSYDSNGRLVNPDGSVSFKKIDDKVASGAWPSNTSKKYISQTVLTDGTTLTDDQRFYVSVNGSQAMTHLVLGQDYTFDGRGLYIAFEESKDPSGNAGAIQGPVVPDVLAFPSDNVINGVLQFKGFEDSDLDTFIANCEKKNGVYPTIGHQEGPTA